MLDTVLSQNIYMLAAAVLVGCGFVLWLTAAVARFEPRPLLNASETKLYRQVQRLLRDGPGQGVWVAPQICYGEFLRCRSRRRYMRVQAKRCDMALVDRDFRVIAVIEYQGRGHYGRSFRSGVRVRRSDRRKRAALKSARIPLIEVPAKYRMAELKREIEAVFPVLSPAHGGGAR